MKIKIIHFVSLMALLIPARPANAQYGKIPPFRMIRQDGRMFKAESLPAGKPIMIIYFSPECEDCQEFMNKIMNRIDDFKSVSIAMITFLPVESLSQFIRKNDLDQHPNFYVGTEGSTFLVRDYYQIEPLLFVALYTKDGDLVKQYSGREIDFNDFLEHLRNL